MPGSRLQFLLFLLPAIAGAASRVQPVPVPEEMRSTNFTITVNRQPVNVAHAAASYDYASFDITGPVDVEITAAEPGFWDRGVDIEPWRLGLRPTRQGQTIRFKIAGPAKLSISRPGDFLNHAKMLFLFAGTPPPPAPGGANVRAFPPGVYRASLNPKSGETIYLAPGSYIFGSLNLWKVENVRVLGRGTIVYDGPQNPDDDDGWMQKPDWHCIGAFEAHHVEIDGLTCIVRSRTWSIQMKDSSGFTYDDLRLIGGNEANANQDGMDWLGGGDTTVRNTFLRASDDDLAMQGNWDGYSEEDLLRPGHDIANIVVENSQLSTSISNIVRLGWPQKTFNSTTFTLRNSNILHAGIGACGQTFGILGVWANKDAAGTHKNIRLENLFVDNWYSLVQVEQENPFVSGVALRNIWVLDQPQLASSTITGDVRGTTIDNVKFGQAHAMNDADLGLSVSGGAEAAKYAPVHDPIASFSVDPPLFAPGDKVTFTALPVRGAQFTWLFGDGSEARGRKVKHRFADADGTDLDGSGRYRVLLRVQDEKGNQDWAAQGVVAVEHWHDAAKPPGTTTTGLEWRIYPGEWPELPDLSKEHPVIAGASPDLNADAHGFTRYAVSWDGFLEIPADGGYTFSLTARDGARVTIDGTEVAKTGPPFAQVCGSPGNAVRFARGSLGLRAGPHALHVEALHSMSNEAPRLLWETTTMRPVDVPAAAYSHVQVDSVAR